MARDAVASPDALGIVVTIDGETVQRASTAGLIRSAARLIAEVSEFMTLAPGDVVSVGVAAGVQLTDGRVLAETEVVWLPPFEVGTIIALGINYADHAKELAKELTMSAKDEPLAFLQAPNTLIGHRGFTRRPRDATFMHYKCELAVIIGKTAKNVARGDAMGFVAGYTVANDYAIRDYLENWYRPNLRVKNRDGCTVLGPWFVPAANIPDPHALALRSFVNDRDRQVQGAPIL